MSTPPPAPTRPGRVLLGIIAATLGAILILGLIIDTTKGPDPALDCATLTNRLLKAPATAHYGGWTRALNPGGSGKITGWVDAENSFGALIRTGVTCTVDAGVVTGAQLAGQP